MKMVSGNEPLCIDAFDGLLGRSVFAPPLPLFLPGKLSALKFLFFSVHPASHGGIGSWEKR